MADWQGIAALVVAFTGLIATILTGVYTGRNARKKDQADHEERVDKAEADRRVAEELAATRRVEELASDAAASRNLLREREKEFDETVRELRRDRDRGWDLARYHFGLLSAVAHLINNVLQVDELRPDDTSALVQVVRAAKSRMKAIVIPVDVNGTPPPAPVVAISNPAA